MTDKAQPKSAEQFEEIGCQLWHKVIPHPGELYDGEAYCLSEKQAHMVWGMVGRCAELYASDKIAAKDREIAELKQQLLEESNKVAQRNDVIREKGETNARLYLEIERLNRAIADWESREASVVPEESTFEAEIERLRKERDEYHESFRAEHRQFNLAWNRAEKAEARCHALSEGLRKRADDFHHPALADHRFSGETVAHELDKLLADPASPAESTETKEKP